MGGISTKYDFVVDGVCTKIGPLMAKWYNMIINISFVGSLFSDTACSVWGPYSEVVKAACAGLSSMDRRVDAIGQVLLSHRDTSVKATLSVALKLAS